MMNGLKKVVAVALAATLTLGSVFTAVAAESPAEAAKTVDNKKAVKATGASVSKVTTTKAGKATVKTVKVDKKGAVTINSTVKVEGVKYTVAKIAANSIKGDVKKVTLKSFVKVDKKAFAKAKKVSKIKVTATVKTAKEKKDLVKALKAAGIKAKNIKVTVKKAKKATK